MNVRKPPYRLIKLAALMSRPELFMARVRVARGCWLWNGFRSPKGYGSYRYNGHHMASHRISYELFIGPIPWGMELDHLCRNPPCVNPWHLEAVTHKENMRRGIGFAGLNARKTTCNKGHSFTKENTYLEKSSKRHCLTCRQEYNALHKEKYDQYKRDYYIAHKSDWRKRYEEKKEAVHA